MKRRREWTQAQLRERCGCGHDRSWHVDGTWICQHGEFLYQVQAGIPACACMGFRPTPGELDRGGSTSPH